MARRFGTVRSMLTELSCRVPGGKCQHTRKYLKALAGYGCNCYSSEPTNGVQATRNTNPTNRLWHFESNGKPLDAVDQACKEAFRSYKCFKRDITNNLLTDVSENCTENIGFKFHMNNNKIICGPSRNPEYKFNQDKRHTCKLAACQIERNFSYKIFKIIGGDPIGWRERHRHNYETFRSEKACQKALQHDMIKKDGCCGEYPDRRPFSFEKEACCNGSISFFGAC